MRSHRQQRWLVAPYRVTDWVRTARAAGQVSLQRGRHREIVRLAELPAADRLPVLRQYLREVPITRSMLHRHSLLARRGMARGGATPPGLPPRHRVTADPVAPSGQAPVPVRVARHS